MTPENMTFGTAGLQEKTVVTLACPFCSLSQGIEQSLLPPAGTTVTCPRCQGRFPLAPDLNAALLKPPPLGYEPLGDATADVPASWSAPQPASVEAASLPPEPGIPPPAPPDSPAAPSSAPPDAPFRTLTFSFTGKGLEYFGIWIVNTLLTIVTLGLYAPWAKVRKRRYFYANTLLDDAPFDYLADPLAILRGWLIAGIFFGLYSLASRTDSVASNVATLLFAVIYPWVLVRARMFALRNSSHRNIRFSFSPNYRDAYKIYLSWPLLLPLTLGLIGPYLLYRQKRFAIENSSYGTTPFQFGATPKQYYLIFLPLVVLLPLTVVVAGVIAFALNQLIPVALKVLLPIVVLLIIYFTIGLYIRTELTNLTWNSTKIASHSFTCRLHVVELAWIYISNAVAIVATFGQLTPWASVRLARYRLSKLSMHGAGALDAFISTDGEPPGAAAEEFGDIVGMDLGL